MNHTGVQRNLELAAGFFIGLKQHEKKRENVRQVRIVSEESLKVRWLPSNFHKRKQKWNYWRRFIQVG